MSPYDRAYCHFYSSSPLLFGKRSVYFCFLTALQRISCCYEYCIIADLLQKIILILFEALTNYFCSVLLLPLVFPFSLVLLSLACFLTGSHGLFADHYEWVSKVSWVLCCVFLPSMPAEQGQYTVDWIMFSQCCKFRLTSLRTYIHPVLSEHLLLLTTFSFPKERQCVPIPTACDGHFDM